MNQTPNYLYSKKGIYSQNGSRSIIILSVYITTLLWQAKSVPEKKGFPTYGGMTLDTRAFLYRLVNNTYFSLFQTGYVWPSNC